jgi:hypothetical protein
MECESINYSYSGDIVLVFSEAVTLILEWGDNSCIIVLKANLRLELLN